MDCDITIGIVTYNEEENIGVCLQSIFNNTIKPSAIIVADNGSTDQTTNIVKEYEKKGVQLILSKKNNLAYARNLILTECETSLLIYVDADCIVSENWIEQLYSQYTRLKGKDSKAAAVGGGNRLPNVGKFKIWNLALNFFVVHGFSPQAYIPKNAKLVEHLPTTNALFEVNALRSIKGFDTKFSKCCEDVDLGLRLSKEFNLYLLPFPVVINKSCPNLFQWAKRMFKFGFFNSKLIHRKKITHLPSQVFYILPFLGILAFLNKPILGLLLCIYFLLLIIIFACYSFKKKLSVFKIGDLVLFTCVTHVSYICGIVAGKSIKWVSFLKFYNQPSLDH